MNRAKAARLLVVFSLVTIAGLTLYPDSSTTTSNWNCIFCGTRATADLVLNILLFAPLGAGFGMLRIRAKNALILAVMLSGAVEVAQLVIPGRAPSHSPHHTGLQPETHSTVGYLSLRLSLLR